MKQVLHIPYARYGKWYENLLGTDQQEMEKAKRDDIEYIENGRLKNLRRSSLNKAQFIDGGAVEMFQCQCGKVFDIDKFIINEVKEAEAWRNKAKVAEARRKERKLFKRIEAGETVNRKA